MSTIEPGIKNAEADKVEWLGRLNALVSLIKGWVEASGWRTRQTTKPVTEAGLGRYEAPLLLMERGGVEVVLSPLARVSPGVDGVVDLYLMPAYDDVASLHFENGRWRVRSAIALDATTSRPSNEAKQLPLGEAAINRILDATAGHAQPL